MKPDFTIITPSLNYGRFLGDCLASVAAQTCENKERRNVSADADDQPMAGAPLLPSATHPRGRSCIAPPCVTVEHLVIDGGSTDDSAAVAARFPHAVWTQEHDQGMSDAINKGFERAQGDWVMWLNADDRLKPGALAEILVLLEKSKADVVYGDWDFIDEAGNFLRHVKSPTWSRFVHVHHHCFIGSTAAFYRRATVTGAGYRLREDFRYVMDGEFYARLDAAGKRFEHVPVTVADFRLHGANASQRHLGKTRDMEVVLSAERQHVESRAIRRAYGITLFEDPYLNGLVDGVLWIAARAWKMVKKVGFHRRGNQRKGSERFGARGDVPAILEPQVPISFAGGPGGATLSCGFAADPSTMSHSLKIAAVFATMNRAETAKKCVLALARQARPPDLVVVADNFSTDDTVEVLENLADLPFKLVVRRLPENRGNAGGVEEAMDQAFAEGADAVWILDDDSWPREAALAALLEGRWNPDIVRHALQVDPRSGKFTWPLQIEDGCGGWRLVWSERELPDGPRVRSRISWTGALVPREVRDAVGPVKGDLFIRGEDEEYPWRIERAGFQQEAIRGAVMDHPGPDDVVHWRFFGKSFFFERGLADWKLYYKVRNMVWLKRRQAGDLAAVKMAIAYSLAAVALDGPQRVQLLRRAIRDGWRGNLGKMRGN